MLHKHGERWTNAEISYMREQFENGLKTSGTLAKEFGVTTKTVKHLMSKNNIKRKVKRKICPFCKKEFETNNELQKIFCTKSCRDKYHRLTNKNWCEKRNNANAKYKNSFRKLWGTTGWKSDSHPIVIASERFIAAQLPKKGYTDIVLTRDYGEKKFPFDILAKKNGELYCFDVTTSFHKTMKKGVRFLLKYLGVKHFHVCHVTPDLTWWCDFEVAEKVSSTCMKEYMQFCKRDRI